MYLLRFDCKFALKAQEGFSLSLTVTKENKISSFEIYGFINKARYIFSNQIYLVLFVNLQWKEEAINNPAVNIDWDLWSSFLRLLAPPFGDNDH